MNKTCDGCPHLREKKLGYKLKPHGYFCEHPIIFKTNKWNDLGDKITPSWCPLIKIEK